MGRRDVPTRNRRVVCRNSALNDLDNPSAPVAAFSILLARSTAIPTTAGVTVTPGTAFDLYSRRTSRYGGRVAEIAGRITS